MANLSDLMKFDFKDFDLKKIDINRLIRSFFDRLESAAITIIVIFLLAGLFYIFNQYRGKMSDYQEQTKLLQEKIQAIADLQDSKKKLEKFVSDLPQELPESNVIKQLVAYSTQNNVVIISYLPMEVVDNAYVSMTKYRLVVWTTNYKNMVRYIRTIESSPFGLRVDEWSGGKTSNKLGGSGVGANIDIISLKTKK